MQPTHYVHILFFSVSGYHYAQKLKETCAFDLVPIDTFWDWKKIFKAIRPDCCLIVRHEFWPAFVACAYRYSRIYAIDVSIRQGTSNLSLQVKRWLFQCFDLVFFVSENDVQLIGETSYRYQVVGNTKFERALNRTIERKDTFEKIALIIDNTYPDLKKLIIGSAWKEDVEAALEAYTLLPLLEQLKWRLIIAPHDVENKMIQDIVSICQRKNLSYQLYGESMKADCEVLIVAEIGILFELYGCSDAALIGGGFKQGVHNIIEPAIYKIPLVSGPLTGSDREAYTYQKKELLVTIENAQQLSRWWQGIDQNKSFQTKLTAQLQTELSATSLILKELNRNTL
ncbi:MAG: 3-deoxy-D-manno-octulosonic-acid transferase [Cytophagaceae bacterium]|nr:3-deoxy-D-manno-octulosonic-acid transferase [Cytophagaceae bacterium]